MVADELLKAIETVDANVQSLAVSHEAALRRIEELKAELRELRSGPPDQA
jgi:chaperonin cofactor prefoldin